MSEGRDRTPGDSSPDPIERGSAPPDARTLAAFGLAGEEPIPLPYGELRSYRVGNAVLKHLKDGSAEVVGWDADLRAGLREDGFRIARPLPVQDGGWITEDGWSASAFLEGGHEYRQQVEACVAAITRYHAALRTHPRPAFFDRLDGPSGGRTSTPLGSGRRRSIPTWRPRWTRCTPSAGRWWGWRIN